MTYRFDSPKRRYRAGASAGVRRPSPGGRRQLVRVALYILATHSTDAKDIAHALGLKNAQAAQKALRISGSAQAFWNPSSRFAARRPSRKKAAPLTAEELRLAAMHDPVVSMLATEAQNYLGKALEPEGCAAPCLAVCKRGIQPEVILLCAAHIASQGPLGEPAGTELDRWAEAGVTGGQEAEQYLQLLAQREKREKAAAGLLGVDPPT